MPTKKTLMSSESQVARSAVDQLEDSAVPEVAAESWLAWRTASMPKVLWIELTSRCPFDCIFCTRKSLRGNGQHMDFSMYQQLVAELDRPSIIRLNYAGESGHYPHLAEAIALAKQSGAWVELVSVLASLKPERLQDALTAGLDRLTVSLHSMDAKAFDAIYRFSSLADLLSRLEQVSAWRQANPSFVLDLAFVAMPDNLQQLLPVAQFAAAQGINTLAVHPLIARDPLPLGNSSAHQHDGSLSVAFRSALQAELSMIQTALPELVLQVSSHELHPHAEALTDIPQAWPSALPPGAVISHCDQSPFDTVHVLADGRVVACEVTEKIALGDLRVQRLRDVWQGPAYRAFRARHVNGSEAKCNDCVYKRAHRPTPPGPRLQAEIGAAEQWLDGWHDLAAGDKIRWSNGDCAFFLKRDPKHSVLRLHGLLLRAGSLHIELDGKLQFSARHDEQIELRLPLRTATHSVLHVRLKCDAASPAALGKGSDQRALGFALISAELN
jgi:MoaA/NifB/PqqE/SkfB family radical SAM enzyme